MKRSLNDVQVDRSVVKSRPNLLLFLLKLLRVGVLRNKLQRILDSRGVRRRVRRRLVSYPLMLQESGREPKYRVSHSGEFSKFENMLLISIPFLRHCAPEFITINLSNELAS